MLEDPDILMVAAVKYPWGEVVTGRRHRYVYRFMAEKGIVDRAGCIEGFVGRSGRFYPRAEAKQVAIAARQISEHDQGMLHSESLWPLTARERSAIE